MPIKQEYRVALRHARPALSHVSVLLALSRPLAISQARTEAADMEGGEPADWTLQSCDRRTGPELQVAA
ncbi:MAG: hypothetical protein JWR10_3414 [Rubritepida sp.]|nr:hypothetical protein [Rubritepida sp.]